MKIDKFFISRRLNIVLTFLLNIQFSFNLSNSSWADMSDSTT